MSHFDEAVTSETASTNCRCKARKKYSIFTPSLRSCASPRQKLKNLRNEKSKNKSCQCGRSERKLFLDETLEKGPSTDSSLSDFLNGQTLLKDFSDDFDKSIEEEVIEEIFSRKVKNVRTRLTEEQKMLLAMEKPPLDRLKEIPIEYLKPRVPNKPKNQFPEDHLGNFIKNVQQRANVVRVENLNKKPYLHPNVEKMFHENSENSTNEISQGTQTEINWNRFLQKKLFYEMDIERKKSFLFDVITPDKNWREFLSELEDHKKINIIDPDLFKKAFRGPFYVCSKFPMDKNDILDKAVNTETVQFGVSELDSFSEKSEVCDTQKQAKGGGDTAQKETERSKSEQEILQSILSGELSASDYLGCLKIIETITKSILKLENENKSGDNLKELNNLKEHHLKHIMKEVDHLFELDKFLKTFESEGN